MPVIADRSGWVLPYVLRRAAATFRDKVFLSFALDDVDITFTDTDRRTDAVAAGLARLGVGSGDNVLIMLRNRLEFVLAWFGVNKLGAVQVPVNIEYRGHFLEHLANTSHAGVIVVESDLAEHVLACAGRLEHLHLLVVVGDTSPAAGGRFEVVAFEELLSPAEPPTVQLQATDLAAIHFTSGTTGPAKGVSMTYAHQHLLAEKNQALVGLGPDDVYLTHLPLFHSNAQFTAVYSSLLVGARVRIEPRFSASKWARQVRESGATVTTSLGVMMAFILEQPERPDDAVNDLRCMWAVPCLPEPAERIRRRFGIERIVSSTGNTEVGMITHHDPAAAPPGSCGLPDTQWYEVRIVDPETDEPVPVGEVGELVVRPRYPWIITGGYFGMPEATLSAFRNLWFHTGDGLRQDENGYLFFVDRIKDRIRRRGENVPTGDVEFVLNEHPAVAESAIVAIPSEIEGGEDEIKACLVLNDGAPAAPEEIFEWCERRLPRFAVPSYVEFRASLPKTQTEKVRRDVLRAEGVTEATIARAAGRRRDQALD